MFELKDVILQLVMYFCIFAYFFSVLFTSFWSELFKRQSFCPRKKVELIVIKWSYFVGGLFCLVFLTFIYYILNTPLDISSSEVQFFGFIAGVAVRVFILCIVSTFNIHFEKR